MKDRHYGDFDTHEIENKWNVEVYQADRKTSAGASGS